MKGNIKKNRKPGFTLVELLIVIIIIGILAGGMMLVAGGSTDKANATKIVGDLRTLKSAALMYYSDNDKWPTNADFSTELKPYIDRDLTGYLVNTNQDYVGYTGTLTTANPGVQVKLAGMAIESGLYDGSATDPTSPEAKYTTGDGVWVRLR